MKFTKFFIVSSILFGATQTMAASYNFTCTAHHDSGPATITTTGNSCVGSFIDDENKKFPTKTCVSKDGGKTFDITLDGVDDNEKATTYNCKLTTSSTPTLTCDKLYTCKFAPSLK